MDKVKRLTQKENRLVKKGYKAVDEGREKKADRLLGRAAKTQNRVIKTFEKMQEGGTASSSFKRSFNPKGITPEERQTSDARDKKRLETVKKKSEQIKTSNLKSRTPGTSYYKNSSGKTNISRTGTVTEKIKYGNATGIIVTPKKGDVQYTKFSVPSKKGTTSINTVDKPSQHTNPKRKTYTKIVKK